MNKTLKTILSLSLAAVLSLLSLSAVFAEGSALLGDVNLDGVVNTDDYIRLKRAYFGTARLNLTEQMGGDMNNNGEIDAEDYIILKRKCLGTADSSGGDSTDGENTLKNLESEALRLINLEREKAGVAPLAFAEEIYECAKVRAKEATVYWSHTRPDGTDYRTVYDDFGFDHTKYRTGENLAGQFSDMAQIIESLMNSEGHRKNILSEGYSSVAIAVVDTERGYFMAQLFLG